MSVYLKDGLVLLHSDLVATDAACCCFTCPTPATLTFTGVSIACGCIDLTSCHTADKSAIFTDNGLAGISTILAGVAGSCFCNYSGFTNPPGPVHYKTYFSTTNCSGGISTTGDPGVTYSVFYDNALGLWEVLAYFDFENPGGTPGKAIIFSGSGANPSAVPNGLSCNGCPTQTFAMSCDSVTNAIGIASGGFATIT